MMDGDILEDDSVKMRVRRLLKKYRAEHETHLKFAMKSNKDTGKVDWTMVSTYRMIVQALEWAIGEGDERNGAYPYLQECDLED